MNSSVIRKLREVEHEVSQRNALRKQPEDVSSSFIYQLYTWIFHCRRSVIKTFFQEDEPRKTLETYDYVSQYPWLCVFAGESDVTDVVNENLLSHVKLSQELLEAVTGIQDVDWSYVDSRTFEIVPIVSSDEVKDASPSTQSATDAVPST